MTKTLVDHPGAEAFLREFQEEHLSEVEFLLKQRRRLLHEPGARWTDAEQFETRLALHLAALRASAEVSLGCAREAVASGDAGQFLAGLHVLAALAPREAGIASLLQAREADLEEVLSTWTEALALAPHPEVAGCCTRALADERPQVRAAAAVLLGHRREGEPARLIPLLAHSPTGQAEPLARAALLLGSRRALAFCRQLCNSGAPPPELLRLLALAGDAQDLPVLHRLCARPALAESALEALGLLGLSAAVPELLEHLEAEDPRHRQAAASALGLEDPRGLLAARSRTALELVLHSGRPFDFEPDWPVRRQREALARWRTGRGRTRPHIS